MSGDGRGPAKVAVKTKDAWWTVLVIDPIAVPLVARVAPLRAVTPNRLTAVSAVIAVLGGVALATGHPVLGGLAIQLSFVLDCMDGKLSQLTHTASAAGGFYDVVADAIRITAGAAGLAIWLAGGVDDLVSVESAAGLAVAYLGVRMAAAAAAEARPLKPPPRTKLELSATPLALLRAAPHRRAAPASTVDTEALALTIGPISGLPVAFLIAALVLDVARLTAYVLQVRRQEREQPVPRERGC